MALLPRKNSGVISLHVQLQPLTLVWDLETILPARTATRTTGGGVSSNSVSRFRPRPRDLDRFCRVLRRFLEESQLVAPPPPSHQPLMRDAVFEGMSVQAVYSSSRMETEEMVVLDQLKRMAGVKVVRESFTTEASQVPPRGSTEGHLISSTDGKIMNHEVSSVVVWLTAQPLPLLAHEILSRGPLNRGVVILTLKERRCLTALWRLLRAATQCVMVPLTSITGLRYEACEERRGITGGSLRSSQGSTRHIVCRPTLAPQCTGFPDSEEDSAMPKSRLAQVAALPVAEVISAVGPGGANSANSFMDGDWNGDLEDLRFDVDVFLLPAEPISVDQAENIVSKMLELIEGFDRPGAHSIKTWIGQETLYVTLVDDTFHFQDALNAAMMAVLSMDWSAVGGSKLFLGLKKLIRYLVETYSSPNSWASLSFIKQETLRDFRFLLAPFQHDGLRRISTDTRNRIKTLPYQTDPQKNFHRLTGVEIVELKFQKLPTTASTLQKPEVSFMSHQLAPMFGAMTLPYGLETCVLSLSPGDKGVFDVLVPETVLTTSTSRSWYRYWVEVRYSAFEDTPKELIEKSFFKQPLIARPDQAPMNRSPESVHTYWKFARASTGGGQRLHLLTAFRLFAAFLGSHGMLKSANVCAGLGLLMFDNLPCPLHADGLIIMMDQWQRQGKKGLPSIREEFHSQFGKTICRDDAIIVGVQKFLEDSAPYHPKIIEPILFPRKQWYDTIISIASGIVLILFALGVLYLLYATLGLIGTIVTLLLLTFWLKGGTSTAVTFGALLLVVLYSFFVVILKLVLVLLLFLCGFIWFHQRSRR